MPRLVEFFLLEDTGRDLHDHLDIVLDMAQEGRPYEKEMLKLRQRIRTLHATAEVPSALDIPVKSFGAYLDTHGRSGRVPLGHNPFSFNRERPDDPKKLGYRAGIGQDDGWMDKGGRYRQRGKIKYTGPKRDRDEMISHWREEAHTNLGNAIVKSRDGANSGWSDDLIDDMMQSVDEVAELSKDI